MMIVMKTTSLLLLTLSLLSSVSSSSEVPSSSPTFSNTRTITLAPFQVKFHNVASSVGDALAYEKVWKDLDKDLVQMLRIPDAKDLYPKNKQNDEEYEVFYDLKIDVSTTQNVISSSSNEQEQDDLIVDVRKQVHIRITSNAREDEVSDILDASDAVLSSAMGRMVRSLLMRSTNTHWNKISGLETLTKVEFLKFSNDDEESFADGMFSAAQSESTSNNSSRNTYEEDDTVQKFFAGTVGALFGVAGFIICTVSHEKYQKWRGSSIFPEQPQHQMRVHHNGDHSRESSAVARSPVNSSTTRRDEYRHERY